MSSFKGKKRSCKGNYFSFLHLQFLKPHVLAFKVALSLVPLKETNIKIENTTNTNVIIQKMIIAIC
jgi:hypothetical protein